MLKSVSEIKEIVDSEVSSGMDEGRILVGGFSQGGALTYLTALTTDRKVLSDPLRCDVQLTCNLAGGRHRSISVAADEP